MYYLLVFTLGAWPAIGHASVINFLRILPHARVWPSPGLNAHEAPFAWYVVIVAII